MNNNNLICPFCLQNINEHSWNCAMNPVNINNISNNNNTYALSWLEIAVKNFKNQNEIVHAVKGNLTIDEFIQKYANIEISKIVKVE